MLPLHDAAADDNIHSPALHAGTLDPESLAATDAGGDTALHTACLFGSTRILGALRKLAPEAFAAQVNTANVAGYTALHYAALEGKPAAAAFVLAAGADTTLVNGKGLTALDLRSDKDNFTTWQWLFELLKGGGGDVGEAVVARALSQERSVDAATKYLASPAGTPLHDAIEHEDVQAVWVMLAEAARSAPGAVDVNACNSMGLSALHWAATVGSTLCISLLAYAGLHPDTPTSTGETALHSACAADQPAAFVTLLALGADPRIASAKGDRALAYRDSEGDAGAWEGLLKRMMPATARKGVAHVVNKAAGVVVEVKESESESEDSSDEEGDGAAHGRPKAKSQAPHIAGMVTTRLTGKAAAMEGVLWALDHLPHAVPKAVNVPLDMAAASTSDDVPPNTDPFTQQAATLDTVTSFIAEHAGTPPPAALPHTAVVDAARANDVAGIDVAVAAGADVNARDSWLASAMHTAAAAGSIDCILRVFELAPDLLNATRRGAWCPIHDAAFEGKPGAALTLLALGAEAAPANNRGDTPITMRNCVGDKPKWEALWASMEADATRGVILEQAKDAASPLRQAGTSVDAVVAAVQAVEISVGLRAPVSRTVYTSATRKPSSRRTSATSFASAVEG